jgi:hypothetical protein
MKQGSRKEGAEKGKIPREGAYGG